MVIKNQLIIIISAFFVLLRSSKFERIFISGYHFFAASKIKKIARKQKSQKVVRTRLSIRVIFLKKVLGVGYFVFKS